MKFTLEIQTWNSNLKFTQSGRTLSLQMVDAEPMGKYISYPHRAATFHIPIGLHVLTSQLRGPGFKEPNGSFTKPLSLKRLKRLGPDPKPNPRPRSQAATGDGKNFRCSGLVTYNPSKNP